ncbi:MAG TPA: diaminopimelate epimerase [Balneolales bacterium]|nr:diaminopimelate epimerase [Balneolales bacterium]
MGQLHFYKMQGAGNDFVLFDNRDLQLRLDQIISITPKLCHRKLGVGADGVLILDHSDIADYTMIYRNADGSDAGMCGNGGRCIALFAHKVGFPQDHTFSVHKKIYKSSVHDQFVTLDFPVTTNVEECKTTKGEPVLKINSGTEHVVLISTPTLLEDEEVLRTKGRSIRTDGTFQPKGTNVNFLNGLSDSHIEIRTYERGVEDLTLACGTGTIASAIAWHHQLHKTDPDNTYTVDNPGGSLTVSFQFNEGQQNYDHIQLKGPAEIVFEGTYNY